MRVSQLSPPGAVRSDSSPWRSAERRVEFWSDARPAFDPGARCRAPGNCVGSDLGRMAPWSSPCVEGWAPPSTCTTLPGDVSLPDGAGVAEWVCVFYGFVPYPQNAKQKQTHCHVEKSKRNKVPGGGRGLRLLPRAVGLQPRPGHARELVPRLRCLRRGAERRYTPLWIFLEASNPEVTVVVYLV